MRGLVVLALVALLTASCASGTPLPTSVAGSPDAAAASQAGASDQPAGPTAAAPVVAAASASSAPRSASCSRPRAGGANPSSSTGQPGVTLYHDPGGYIDAQVELISPKGHRVLIDVANPEGLSKPAQADDILLTTHDHDDHVDADFIAGFAGRNVPEGGGVTVGDVKVTGIAAAHGTGDGPATVPDGSDYIYLVEIGGIRVAHFGDFGQRALTQSQLDALGPVDVAITQLDNPYSSVDAANHLAYDMIEQLCPPIVIPTHMLTDSTADLALALKMWKGTYSPNVHVHLSYDSLPAETTVLVLGNRGASVGPFLRLPISDY